MTEVLYKDDEMFIAFEDGKLVIEDGNTFSHDVTLYEDQCLRLCNALGQYFSLMRNSKEPERGQHG